MKISPTEERAWDIIMCPAVPLEADIALGGLVDVVEQSKNGTGGWVMRQIDEPTLMPMTDEAWPVRALYNFEA